MSNIQVGMTGVVILLLLLAARVPIAFALGGVAVAGIMVLRGPEAAFGVLSTQPYGFIAHWTLTTVPMFLLMGTLAYHAGLTQSLYAAARLWLSWMPGGLAVASTAACAGFAAASGSSVATASAMGRIAIPEMMRYRYDPGLATGCVAAAGTLGSLIPPSILMVIYAIFAEVSVSKALMAGIIPGILSAIMFGIMIVVRCSINPKLGPPIEETVTWAQRLTVLTQVWPLPLLILGVIGGMYSGAFTSTEAAAGGAFLAFVIAGVQRRLSWMVIRVSIVDSLTGTAAIFLIAVGGVLLSRFMAFSGLPLFMGQWIGEYAVNPLALIVMICVVYLFLGCLLDSIGIMLLTLPILLPMLDAAKVDLIWFGVLVIKLLEIGLITPPVGMNVFVIKSVVGDAVSLERIFKGITWFVVTDIVTLGILIAYPQISLLIPKLME
jgi:tripartite ATP-independent transporter DctM subunit